MPIITNGFNIGTATATVITESSDAQHVVLQNLEPANSSDAYAKAGRLFLLQREFTVNSPGTAIFEVETGANGLQIDSYEIVSTAETIKGELIEGATVTTTGSAIPAYNLNRNESDAHDAIFLAGTAISGGTAIAAELLTADKHAAAGGMTSGKIFTLAPSTKYAFKFVNRGNQATTVHLQLLFSEQFNGDTDIWISGAAEDTIRIRGGETLHIPLLQSQTLTAESATTTRLGVLQQD